MINSLKNWLILQRTSRMLILLSKRKYFKELRTLVHSEFVGWTWFWSNSRLNFVIFHSFPHAYVASTHTDDIRIVLRLNDT